MRQDTEAQLSRYFVLPLLSATKVPTAHKTGCLHTHIALLRAETHTPPTCQCPGRTSCCRWLLLLPPPRGAAPSSRWAGSSCVAAAPSASRQQQQYTPAHTAQHSTSLEAPAAIPARLYPGRPLPHFPWLLLLSFACLLVTVALLTDCCHTHSKQRVAVEQHVLGCDAGGDIVGCCRHKLCRVCCCDVFHHNLEVGHLVKQRLLQTATHRVGGEGCECVWV